MKYRNAAAVSGHICLHRRRTCPTRRCGGYCESKKKTKTKKQTKRPDRKMKKLKSITHETTARSAPAVTHISTASVCLPEQKISYLFLLQTTSVHSRHISCRAALSSPYFHSSGGADPRRLCRIWFPCAHNSPPTGAQLHHSRSASCELSAPEPDGPPAF